MSATSGARQGIVSLAVKDKAALYNAYMPYIRHGGIFVGTPNRYFLGDEVFLLLTLPESGERMPVAGKVVWVTPAGAQGNRPAGIGIQFGEGATAGRHARRGARELHDVVVATAEPGRGASGSAACLARVTSVRSNPSPVGA